MGPGAELIQRNRRRIDQPQHLGTFPLQRSVGMPRQSLKDFCQDTDRPSGIGIRKRRARQFADTKMVVMMQIGVPDRLKGTQATDATELGKYQCDKMIPAVERLVVGVAIQTIHSRLKLPPIDRFKQPSKNAIAKPHARALSESRQPESTCFTLGKPGHAPRQSESFPGQPCASVGNPIARITGNRTFSHGLGHEQTYAVARRWPLRSRERPCDRRGPLIHTRRRN